jgi:hypothetical protein
VRACSRQLGKARRQHLGVGQQALAHTVGEGVVLDDGEPLDRRIVVELGVRIDAQQIGRVDQPLEGRQLAGLDLLLERAARHADEAGGAVNGEQLRHGGTRTLFMSVAAGAFPCPALAV